VDGIKIDLSGIRLEERSCTVCGRKFRVMVTSKQIFCSSLCADKDKPAKERQDTSFLFHSALSSDVVAVRRERYREEGLRIIRELALDD